jgi:hypothetical protein
MIIYGPDLFNHLINFSRVTKLRGIFKAIAPPVRTEPGISLL